MALAIAVSACLLAVGAPVIGSLCMVAGLGMIDGGFFGMGILPHLEFELFFCSFTKNTDKKDSNI